MKFAVLFEPTSEFIDPFCYTLFFHLYWNAENVKLLRFSFGLTLGGVKDEYELENINAEDPKLKVAGLWH